MAAEGWRRDAGNGVRADGGVGEELHFRGGGCDSNRDQNVGIAGIERFFTCLADAGRRRFFNVSPFHVKAILGNR